MGRVNRGSAQARQASAAPRHPGLSKRNKLVNVMRFTAGLCNPLGGGDAQHQSHFNNAFNR
jgi:hypothetical protein